MAITGENTSQSFSYTGGVQSFTIPYDGLYKLEVWGAKGYSTAGGNGGYSYGYKEFKKGTVLYICCGGNNNQYDANYNGGGKGNSKGPGYSGGGATHIALVTGTIASIGVTNFVTNKKGLIVAGGGGGGRYVGDEARAGGAGGGTTGGMGAYNGGTGNGGTQTAGGNSKTDGSFGTGANSTGYGPGGGGGLYGGGGEHSGAGGGSGYIGGVPAVTFKDTSYSPYTQQGGNSGAGKATITFVKRAFPTMYLGNTLIDGMFIGVTAVDDIK